MQRWLGWFVVLAFWPSTATALQQPDGTTIPVGNSLQNLFDGRGEAINALADAQILPETFTPTCKLQFEVLQRNAGFNNSFGWYNEEVLGTGVLNLLSSW